MTNRLPMVIILLVLVSLHMAVSLKAFYVGSFTSNEISVFYMDQDSLLQSQTIAVGYTPTWITLSPSSNIIYATNEQNGYIASLSVNMADGRLNFVDRVTSSGSSPTYVTTSPAGDYVLAANYDTGSDVVVAVGMDGLFGKTTNLQQHNGTGPVPGRQTGPHAHQIIFDNPGHFVYSADLGADKVYQYRFVAPSGVLQPLDIPFFASDPGDGPRHLTFHQNNNWAYLTCELSSSVIVFKVDGGILKRIQKLLTVPAAYTSNNYPAEPIVHPNGNFLFVSNRGNDSISVFSISNVDGTLTPVSVYPVNGAYPRGMVLDPSTNIIFAMNQNSGSITALSVNPTTGHLTFLSVAASQLVTPVCGLILTLN